MAYTRVAVALLATVSIAACSSGTKTTAPTKASGEAAAKAINLTKADLPAEFTGAPSDSEDKDSPQEVAFAACVGASPPNNDLADVSSDDFSKGNQINLKQVSSDVTVVASADTAKKDLAAYQGSKTEDCLKTFVGDLLKEQTAGGSVSFGPPTTAKLPTDVPGTDGGFGFTVTSIASASGITLPFEIAIQGFLHKHTAVSLTTVSVGTPFPSDIRSDLLDKLVKRTKGSAV